MNVRDVRATVASDDCTGSSPIPATAGGPATARNAFRLSACGAPRAPRKWTTVLLAFKIHFGDRVRDTAS
jgi:hypothetical protein